MNEQFRERNRREYIAHWSGAIERAQAMLSYAKAGGIEFSDHELRELNKDIVDNRRAILAELTTAELSEMSTKSLPPERAMEIVRDPPKQEDSAEVKKLQHEPQEIRRANLATMEFYVAEKGFNGLPPSGVSIAELAAQYPNQLNFLKRLKLPKIRKEPAASIADAFLNHIPTK
jgi:hypothetical protein